MLGLQMCTILPSSNIFFVLGFKLRALGLLGKHLSHVASHPPPTSPGPNILKCLADNNCFMYSVGTSLSSLFFKEPSFELRTYTLSHSTSPFVCVCVCVCVCEGFFQNRVSRTVCPELASNFCPDLCLLSS
jgi:hypothetical protein